MDLDIHMQVYYLKVVRLLKKFQTVQGTLTLKLRYKSTHIYSLTKKEKWLKLCLSILISTKSIEATILFYFDKLSHRLTKLNELSWYEKELRHLKFISQPY